MITEKDVIGRIGKSSSIVKIIGNHLGYYGKQDDIELVRLIIEDLHPVIERTVKYLEQFTNLNDLPLPSAMSALIGFGIYRLWWIPSVEEWAEFTSGSLSELTEVLSKPRFLGLESLDGKPVSLKFHKWVFRRSEVLAESLGLEDPRTICLLALITGLIGCSEISPHDQEAMLSIIRKFSSWVDGQLREVKELDRLTEEELFRGSDESWVATYGISHSANWNDEWDRTVLQ